MLATSPPTSAYSSMPIASSPPAPPMSFKHIQDQEARAHEALRQISNKSLEKIQVLIFPFSSKFKISSVFFLIDWRISNTSITSALQIISRIRYVHYYRTCSTWNSQSYLASNIFNSNSLIIITKSSDNHAEKRTKIRMLFCFLLFLLGEIYSVFVVMNCLLIW